MRCAYEEGTDFDGRCARCAHQARPDYERPIGCVYGQGGLHVARRQCRACGCDDDHACPGDLLKALFAASDLVKEIKSVSAERRA